MPAQVTTLNAERRHDVTLTFENLTDSEFAQLVAVIGRTTGSAFYEEYKVINDRREALGIEIDWSI